MEKCKIELTWRIEHSRRSDLCILCLGMFSDPFLNRLQLYAVQGQEEKGLGHKIRNIWDTFFVIYIKGKDKVKAKIIPALN
jgi:hypothetical protein